MDPREWRPAGAREGLSDLPRARVLQSAASDFAESAQAAHSPAPDKIVQANCAQGQELAASPGQRGPDYETRAPTGRRHRHREPRGEWRNMEVGSMKAK